MDFNEIYQIKDETEQIQKIYELINEDIRLTRSKAARVEFLTNVRYIEKYLKSGDKILDLGAGAGEYSLYFAKQGYHVSAVELTDANVAAFRKKITDETPVDLVQGTALDLSRYPDGFFDVVLLFGPLYHLHRIADRLQCISEAKRVCKKSGTIFFAFISNDPVIMTEFSYRPDYFTAGDYDKETFQVEDFPFVFHTVDECRGLLADGGVRILHEVASDGLSELMEDKINTLDDAGYAQYLRYHEYLCEKPECLGWSNHLLFVGTAE
ncbi:MAG: class I SAM-dependent methyltransferase [Clostridia bacterium]|nr:class I SAM-dependent methyltransferase [Clostridia bacterium]